MVRIRKDIFLLLVLALSVRGQALDVDLSEIGRTDVELSTQGLSLRVNENQNDNIFLTGNDSDVEKVETPEEVTVQDEVVVKSGAYSMLDGDDAGSDDTLNLADDTVAEQSERQLISTTTTTNIYDHIDGRVLPTTSYSNSALGYTITQARLTQVRANFMYWYYDQGGDENIGDYQRDIHSSSPQIHKNFNFQLPFFGFRFNYTRVSMHGYLEFSDPPDHYTYPLTFPIRDWPQINDPSFIGIFFSKCRIGSIRPDDIDQRRPGVYFRMDRDLQTRTDQLGVEMRERVKWDVRTGVIGAENFFPKHAATVTWKNMSFAGGIGNSLFKTNTFQMVLATDEVFTYAIFNYAEINWSSHTEAGGDTTGGEGGVPAYIGFNAGNGTQSYEYMPYSQASVLRDLTGRGWANGFPGRHIFRIDEKILMGTCNKDIDGANLPLMFAPESGTMLGGTIVNITGPCFLPNDRIVCRFDTEDVVGAVVDTNRAICVQPRFLADGYVKFEIAINNEPFKWKGKFFVETPATASEKIYFETDDVHQMYPSEIKITWDQYNLTTNLNVGLKISLYGYKETTIRPQLELIDVLEEGVSNTGVYVISPGNYRNRDNFLTNDMQFGFIQINLTTPVDENLQITPVLWSRPIPLGWYFAPQWEKIHGTRWPERMCNNWLTNDRFLKNFAADLPICPCTLEHALLDKGRFLPDFDCDKDANPRCKYHWGAVHCVRSGNPSLEGSGQQCCYDKNGYLMMSYDQQWGSRPHRSHNLGFLPWNEANKVPSLSHWFHDMVPFYQCCLWQHEQAVGCETFRFERRPSQDCVAYQPPGVAGIFGDPHIITFDDVHYTFNGKGEYVLVRVDEPLLKLDVQGRFEQVARNAYGPVNATHLTSIAATANTSITVEVRLRPQHAQFRYHLDVFADGRRVYFDRSSLKVQRFQGVVVYTPTYILNQSEVIIMFPSGAGIEVIENKGFMSARVYLPWNYINKTRGLFGNWSWDMTDDFVRPDGTFVPINLNNFQSAHVDFAAYWQLTDRFQENIGTALFYREFGRTSAYYSDATFIQNYIMEPANFLLPNRSADINRATEICDNSYQCRYDYGMTLNRDMAEFTKNYYSSIVNIKEQNSKRVLSCGVLETPRFGRKSNFLFTPGNKVTFECNQNFILIGDQRRTCGVDGRWDLPEYGYTECLRQQEYSSRSLILTSGIIFGVMLPILLLMGIIWFCIQKSRNDSSTSWKFENLEPRSRSNSRANLRSASMGNLTDTLKSSSLKSDKTDRKSKDLLDSPVPDVTPIVEEHIQSRAAMPLNESVDKESSAFGHTGSDRSDKSDSSTLPKKRRSYDKTYRTHEPLPNAPDVEFPEKLWDLSEEDITSLTSNDSSSNRDTLTKPAKDIQYRNVPRQTGRRNLLPTSSESGYSTVNKGSSDFTADDPYSPKFGEQYSPISSHYSPTYSEIYSPPTSPTSDLSPKPSYLTSYEAPITPKSAPADTIRTFTLPIQRGKSVETLIDPPANPNIQGIMDPQNEIETFSSRTTMVTHIVTCFVHNTGKQEYSSRTLGATWGIISAIIVPILLVLVCLGYRIIKKRKEEQQEDDLIIIKSQPIETEDSVKVTNMASDGEDDSIPYKKNPDEGKDNEGTEIN